MADTWKLVVGRSEAQPTTKNLLGRSELGVQSCPTRWKASSTGSLPGQG